MALATTQKIKESGKTNTEHKRQPRRTVAQARKGEDTTEWKKVYERVRLAHQKFATFQYVPRSTLPPDAQIRDAVVNFTYKYDKKGNFIGHKARFSYPGNRLALGYDYEITNTAVYAADRDAVRLMLAMAPNKALRINHIDLESAFLH